MATRRTLTLTCDHCGAIARRHLAAGADEAAAETRAAEIARCGMCDADGYRGTTVCDHIARPPRKSLRALVAEMQAEGAEPDLDPAQDEPGPETPPLRSVS